jgi:DNA polymerase-3 subunit epsilon
LNFDLDIYKIVKKAITGSYKTNIVKLFSTQEETASYDAVA